MDGLKFPTISSKLTKAEKEVLDMITINFYTFKQIVLIRKTSEQAVYKIIRKLKQKGYLNLGLQKGLKFQGTNIKPNLNQVRLHGQEFNIKILFQDHRYQNLFKKSNIRFIDGHTIKLYRNSIEIYAGEGISFLGDNESRADKKSMDYWTRFFIKLEHELKIVIIKDKSSNIKEVNHHYERGNSEICQNSKERKEIIRIYAVEDGKLAYWTDSSFGGDNDETGHPETAKPDRKAIDKQVNDWRLNNPPTNSELLKFQAENTLQLKKNLEVTNMLIELQKDVPKNMSLLAEQIKAHLKLINEYRLENIKWRKGQLKEIKDELKHGKQLKLFDFK